MTMETGTAIDFHDLLDKLNTFTTNNGWTQLEHTPAPIGAGIQRQEAVQTLTIRGPGTGAGREVFITIHTISDTVNQVFSWQPYGHIAYNSSRDVGDQAGVGPSPYLTLSNGTMTYWFYINDRRIIVVVRLGTTYVSMYAGFLISNALPDENPYPLYIAANYSQNVIPSFANARNRFIADPGIETAFVRLQSGIWDSVGNHTLNTAADTGYNDVPGIVVIPFGSTFVLDTNDNNADWCYGGMRMLRPTVNNEVPIWPCIVINGNLNVNEQVGILDGVFAVPGFERTAEETIMASGKSLLLFTNIFRSSFRDFMGIEDT